MAISQKLVMAANYVYTDKKNEWPFLTEELANRLKSKDIHPFSYFDWLGTEYVYSHRKNLICSEILMNKYIEGKLDRLQRAIRSFSSSESTLATRLIGTRTPLDILNSEALGILPLFIYVKANELNNNVTMLKYKKEAFRDLIINQEYFSIDKKYVALFPYTKANMDASPITNNNIPSQQEPSKDKCDICKREITDEDDNFYIEKAYKRLTCARASCSEKMQERIDKKERQERKERLADLPAATRKQVEHELAAQHSNIKGYRNCENDKKRITKSFIDAIKGKSPEKFKACFDELLSFSILVHSKMNDKGLCATYCDDWLLTYKLIKEFEKVYPFELDYIDPELKNDLESIVSRPFTDPNRKEIHLYISKHNPFRKWLPESLDGFKLIFMKTDKCTFR